jgi:hypothetical protein
MKDEGVVFTSCEWCKSDVRMWLRKELAERQLGVGTSCLTDSSQDLAPFITPN